MNKILKVEESTKSTLPKHLLLLVERMGKERYASGVDAPSDNFLPVECDLIFAISLVVALEEGYRLDDVHKSTGYDCRVFDSLLHLPNFRRKNGTYALELLLPRLKDMSFHLIVANVFEDCTLLTVTSLEKKIVRHTASTVVPHAKFLMIKNKGADVFKNLAELCRVVKNPLSYVRLQALRYSGLPSADIIGLPDDIKRLIFRKLKVNEFLSLCSASTQMYHYVTEEDIWRYFLKRDFKTEPVPHIGAKATYQLRIRNRPSTSLPYYHRFEEQYRTSSDFSYDITPMPEQFS